MRGLRGGDVRVAGAVAGFVALGACGGLSESHEAVNGGTTSSATGGSSTTSGVGGSGGVSGGPSVDMLVSGCTAVCNKGKAASCPVFDVTDCTRSCTNASYVLDATSQCANSELEYLTCVEGLANVCDVLSSSATPTECDTDGSVVQSCILEICGLQPAMMACASE